MFLGRIVVPSSERTQYAHAYTKNIVREIILFLFAQHTFFKNIPFLGKVNLTWLFIVMMAFLYNAVVIPLRFAFRELVQTSDNVIYWLIIDYICDLIYIIDITVFEVRMTFLDNGTVQVRIPLYKRRIGPLAPECICVTSLLCPISSLCLRFPASDAGGRLSYQTVVSTYFAKTLADITVINIYLIFIHIYLIYT